MFITILLFAISLSSSFVFHVPFNHAPTIPMLLITSRLEAKTFGSSSDITSLLDIEQAKGMAGRALVEEELLLENQDILVMADEGRRKHALKAVKKMQKAQSRGKSSSGVGGFGGATRQTKTAKKSKSYSYTARLDKDGFGSILINDGVARINNVLEEETVEGLRTYVNDVLEEEISSEAESSNSGNFARVLQPKNRWDLLLPLDSNSAVMKAMDELIGKNHGTLNSILESTVGEGGVLYELAALVSDPGSERQVIHPDIPFESEDSVSLVTCFFALQDIDETMGPTVYLPGTNTKYHHEKFNNRATADALLSETESVLATLSKLNKCE